MNLNNTSLIYNAPLGENLTGQVYHLPSPYPCNPLLHTNIYKIREIKKFYIPRLNRFEILTFSRIELILLMLVITVAQFLVKNNQIRINYLDSKPVRQDSHSFTGFGQIFSPAQSSSSR